MKHGIEKLKILISMAVFGTIGIFRRYIPYSSSFIAFARGLIGAAAIYVILLLRKERIDRQAVKAKLFPLILSGAFIGANWVLLFEAYRYTTVSVATVCYYMAPVFAVLGAAVFFKDRLTVKKLLCIIISCAGMVLVSGIIETGLSGITGCLFGLGAAVLYAGVMLLNRSMPDLRAFDRTIVQLAASAVVVGIYTAFTEDFSQLSFSGNAFVMLLIVGVIHTGICYSLYFSGMASLPTQTVAIFSYIDPIVSILLSALILKESLTFVTVIGIVMVLGGTIISELSSEKEKA